MRVRRSAWVLIWAAASPLGCSSSDGSDAAGVGGAGGLGGDGGGAASAGSAGTGGTTGVGGTGATGVSGGSAGAGGCATDTDCEGLVPPTQPPGCAEGVCDQGVCTVKARDKDQDEKRNKFCKDPDGNVEIETGNDCDDGDPTIHPGAWDGPEGDGNPASCDGIDQDCSGTADDAVLSDMTSCACKPGTIAECSELPNGQPIEWPTGVPVGECKTGTKKCVADLSTGSGKWELCTGAVAPTIESCDGEDDDCDGEVDEDDAVDKKLWMCDADGDGHLSESPVTEDSCWVPASGCAGLWVTSGPKDDCDDEDAQAAPGWPELCDGRDNDCSGQEDDNPVNPTTWYLDGDGDGYGDKNTSSVAQCDRPGATWKTLQELSGNTNNDCVDTNAGINPGIWDGPAKKKVPYGYAAPGLDTKLFAFPQAVAACTTEECIARAAHDAINAGTASSLRTDLAINFDWMRGAPDPGMATNYDRFAVQWTGKLRPPQTGNYTFHAYVDDGMRLVIDGKTILPGWSMLEVDYSTTANPSNGWTYGWKATPTGTFTKFDTYTSTAYGGYWHDASNSQSPHIWKNATSSAAYGVAPGQVSVHPGQTGQYPVVRFTVPMAAARCTATGTFLAGDGGDTEGIVLHNNVVKYTAATTHNSPTFDVFLNDVQAQDTIDFVVGYKGDWSSDNTPVKVAVTCLGNPIVAPPVALDATKEHDIRVDYFEVSGGAVARLAWTGPGLPSGGEVVMTQLDPVGGDAPDSCEASGAPVDNDCSGTANDGVVMDNAVTGLARRCLVGPDRCDPTVTALAASLNRECGIQPLVGICHNGNQMCLPTGFWSVVCAGEQAPILEVCNSLDDNCNGQVDDGASPQKWTLDNDADGWGKLGQAQVTSCEKPTSPAGNWVAGIPDNKLTDCNDNDPNTFPGQTEACDSKDNNCNNQVDESVPPSSIPCSVGVGECVNTGVYLCSNGTFSACSVQPKAATPEACDGKDNDCNGLTDDSTFLTYQNGTGKMPGAKCFECLTFVMGAPKTLESCAGDNEFGGNGPDVYFDLRFQPIATGAKSVQVVAKSVMKEVAGDTVGCATAYFNSSSTSDGRTIKRVLSRSITGTYTYSLSYVNLLWLYRDSNHYVDLPTVDLWVDVPPYGYSAQAGGLNVSFVGDTSGGDVCSDANSCSYLYVRGPVSSVGKDHCLWIEKYP